MDVQKAQKIVSRAVSGRARWGKLYACENTMEEVLDALMCLDEAMILAVNHQDNLVEKEDLTKARRQVTAAKAREARQKKQIAKLEEKVEQLEKEVWDWSEQCGNQEAFIRHLQGECPENCKNCGE